MKKSLLYSVLFSLLAITGFSQEKGVNPSVISTGTFIGISPALRDLPAMTQEEYDAMALDAKKRKLNHELKDRFYPNAENAFPKGEDPARQKKMGNKDLGKAPLLNFSGQSSPYSVSDCNGTTGPNHYMQTVNTTYAIYNKSGVLVAGPTNMNLLFGTVAGANRNDGDPVVIYDEQADRWLAAEFSLDGYFNGGNDRMLIAVSTTNDPTGTWYQYSFDVDDMPDYEKLGVWRDGYYMSTNNSAAKDIYVLERDQMLVGGTAQMIGFDNPNRPNSGFHVVPPADNDGPFAPEGESAIFVTVNDDAWSAGTNDELWIFELDVDWATPANSTFTRTQQIAVPSFDSNFGSGWDNIAQLGTTQKLDAVPQILMQRPQYRNFCDYQTLVCCHTVDVDNTDHAGIRWYELRKTTGNWSLRQYGTYAPDGHSRWMGSIALNNNNELALGYSISSSSMYPGIRYCGQSAATYNAASGLSSMDIAESVIQNGTQSATGSNRWGDYANISLDPNDDHTFWFTTEYYNSGKKTKIASFRFSNPSPPRVCFTADNLYPLNSTQWVNFTDLSSGAPSAWSWTISPATFSYVGGTSSTSQNPSVSFTQPGAYTVTLTVTNGAGNDSETKTDYIHVGTPGVWTGSTSDLWSTNTNWQNHEVPTSTVDVSITQSGVTNWPLKNGGLNIGTDCNSLNFGSGSSSIQINGDLVISSGKTLYVDPSGVAVLTIDGNWTNNGTFTPGQSQVLFNSAANTSINTPAGGATYLINDDMSSFPTDWSGDIGSGQGFFESNSSNNAGGGSPESRFHWLSGTNTKRMIHTPVNTSGISSATLDFKHMVDDYSGTGYTIKVQYSTDGTTWTDLWSVSPTADIVATTVSLPLTTSVGLGSSTYYISFMITGNTYNIDYWYIDDVQLHYTMPTTETFYDLIIASNNATISTNGDITVQHNFRLFPKGEYTNPVGKQLNILGDFNLETSSLLPTGIYSFLNQGTVSVGGNITYEQYLTASSWHIVSPPVLTSSLPYSGIYLYERNEIDSTYTNITSDSYPLLDEEGYFAWATANATISFMGPNVFNETDRNVSLSYTPSGYVIGTNAGYHLLGNPYASYLNWNGSANWNLNNVDATAYFWDAAAGQYKTWNGTTGTASSGWIPPTQGFYVKANATGATLTIPSSERGHSSQGFYKNGEFASLKIGISGNNYSDEIILSEVENATMKFDNNYDAYHLNGIEEAPQLSLFMDNVEMTMNAIPKITEDLTIPLHLTVGNESLYEISILEETLENTSNIYLEDISTNTWVDLKESSYEFSASPYDDIHRFNLRFATPNNVVEEESRFVNIYSLDHTIYVQTDTNEGEIKVYDMLGQLITSRAIISNKTSIILPQKTSYYLVEVKNKDGVTTRKVYLK